jgi:5-methylcytosine-specific restriction endonuclease McrA
MAHLGFKQDCKDRDAVCWLDGLPIDYDAPPLSPDSFEVDHYHPVAIHPESVFEYSNLRAVHSRCNRSRRV